MKDPPDTPIVALVRELLIRFDKEKIIVVLDWLEDVGLFGLHAKLASAAQDRPDQETYTAILDLFFVLRRGPARYLAISDAEIFRRWIDPEGSERSEKKIRSRIRRYRLCGFQWRGLDSSRRQSMAGDPMKPHRLPIQTCMRPLDHRGDHRIEATRTDLISRRSPSFPEGSVRPRPQPEEPDSGS